MATVPENKLESHNSIIASTISILSESSSDSSDSDDDQQQGITIHELCVSGTLHEVTQLKKLNSYLSFSYQVIELLRFHLTDQEVRWSRAS